MSTGQHTLGRLEAFCGYMMRICHGDTCSPVAEISTPYRKGVGIVRGEAEATANLRRMVACWNACDGSSTEWLEFQNNPDAIEQFGRREPFETRYQKELRKGLLAIEQRDKLLGALRAVLDEVQGCMVSSEKRARDVIAEVSGGFTPGEVVQMLEGSRHAASMAKIGGAA